MIRVEDAGAVRTIRLDRSEKRNALTARLLDDLVAAIKKAEQSRVIVIEPIGPVFCAGFDLTECRENAEALPSLLTGLAWATATMRASPAIVVAAAPGAAIAGGCALLCGCDIVISTPEAKFGYPVLKIGISPAVSAPLLKLAMGDGASRARMLSTDFIDGRAAHHLGLVHELLDSPEACIARAHELAGQLISKPPTGLSATKSWLNEVDGSLAGNKIQLALETSLSLVGGEEQNELLAELWRST
ncbi:MAG: enoyl-CoA hydratase/isomerase family protein [Phycisphaerales bacterium]|nr:enoyl-CoA hydratase/isomerase family protein [Phycisphaerales bacterium]